MQCIMHVFNAYLMLKITKLIVKMHALCMHNAHKVLSFSAKEAVGSRYTFFFRDVLLAYL